MSRRHWQGVVWAGLGPVMLGIAWLLINTSFMFYDDEGYVLHTLRAFLEGQRLYTDIFSQYGPGPYVYHWLLFGPADLPLTHMAGRGLTALHWALCGVLAGWLARRLAPDQPLTASITGGVAAFSLLWQMCSEPSHPGSMLSLLVAAAACLAAGATDSRRPLAWGAGLGAVVAVVFLTKINVGLLLVAGVGCAALRFTAWPGRWRRLADGLALLGFLALPWGLMAPRLSEWWPLVFALQFTAAAAGLLWVTPGGSRPLAPRLWHGAAGGFVGAALLVSSVVLMRGTGLRELLEAVLLSPLKHPASFMVEFNWAPAVWPVSLGSWLVAALAGWQLRYRGGLTAGLRWLVIAVRLAALLAFVVYSVDWLTLSGVAGFIIVCLPLAPVFVIPLRGADGARPMTLAALVALPQVLHAFPIAGSQMGWGTFLLVPLFVSGLLEGIAALAASIPPKAGRRLIPVLHALLLTVSAGQLWLLATTGWTRFTTSRPLGLPGAEDIRLNGAARTSLRLLTLNAAVHTDVLFSRPGMYSYNLWSGAATPTTRNATHWFWLLNDSEQAAIIAQLEATPRRGYISNRGLDRFMDQIGLSMESPLQTHLRSGYRRLFRYYDSEFWVPRSSRAVPFGMLELLAPAADSPGGLMLRANLVLDGQPATVSLEETDPPWTVVRSYSGSDTRGFIEPITADGRPLGPPLALPASVALRGLYRLTVFTDDPTPISGGQTLALYVRDPGGRLVAEAGFLKQVDDVRPAGD